VLHLLQEAVVLLLLLLPPLQGLSTRGAVAV
jgi:hypothetical protein